MNRHVLVSGGCSGIEAFPSQFVQSLGRNPVANVETIITNPLAVQQGVHTVDHPYSLMMAFGAREPKNNEERCADRLEEKANEFDLVADIHTSPSAREMYAIVGPEAKPIVWQALAALGVQRVVISDTPGSFYDHILNGLTIQYPETIAEDEDAQQHLRRWLGRVASDAVLPKTGEYELYKYAGWVEREDVVNAPDSLSLPDFSRLKKRYYRHLSLRGPLYALGWFASGTICQGEMVRRAKGWQVIDGQLVRPKAEGGVGKT